MTAKKRFPMILPAIAGVLMMNCSGASASELSSVSNPYCEVSSMIPADSVPDGNDRILPRDGMIEGRLDNGLGYAVMRNGSPSRMIECRLIFRAGSAMETDGNRGAAHFLEHMAFGGTRHFPGRKLVDYLESLGVQYGVGINAFTGYDRTVYMFSVPSDDTENLDRALLILRDWLTDIDITERKVEGEKGIILEELRSYDIGDEFYGLKVGNGIYSRGIPLGTAEDISSMTARKLKDFHNTWYTPDRATVAIVGDVDPEDAERRIARVFGDVGRHASPGCPNFPLEYPSGVSVQSVADTLARGVNLEIIVPHSALMRGTLDEAVRSERNRMLVRGISRRFYALGISANISNSWYLADKEHFVISVSGDDQEEASSELKAAVAEIYRIGRDGFGDAELDDLKKSFSYQPYAPGNSYMLCEEVVDAVLFGDRAVTDSLQASYVDRRLAATTSTELQEILNSWLDDAEDTFLAAYRYNPDISSPAEAGFLEKLWHEASCTECAPYEFECGDDDGDELPARTVIPGCLLKGRPYDASLIRSREYYGNIGVTDVHLTNGLRFVLRPTDDEEGKIQLQMFAPGGLSRVPEDEYARYEGLAGYMELGGIEGVDDDVYYSLLSENGIGLLLAVESYWHGMIASAPEGSLRLMLNLIYGRMMHPKLNYEEFEEIREGELEDFGDESYLSRLMEADVQRQLNMQIDSLMGNLMYGRRTEVTREDLECLDLDDMADVYRKLYSNPSGMTFVVCGSFDPDSFLREAVPVFGQIPAGTEPNSMGDSHFSLPDATRKIEFPNADETQTVFDYIRFGTYEPSLRSGLKLKLMNNLIRNRLLTVLREQESLVYSPYASLYYTAYPDRVFYMDINASVDRRNTSRVHEILDSIIEDLQKHKVPAKELNTLKRIFVVNKRTTLEEDATSAWKGYLVARIRNGETISDLDMYDEVLESITAAELRDEFRRCFDTDRYMILSMGKF